MAATFQFCSESLSGAPTWIAAVDVNGSLGEHHVRRCETQRFMTSNEMPKATNIVFIPRPWRWNWMNFCSWIALDWIRYKMSPWLFRYCHIKWALSPRHGASWGCGWREGLQIRKVATNILNKHSQTANKGWSSRLMVGRRTNISPL
jgi:hypothetical protein